MSPDDPWLSAVSKNETIRIQGDVLTSCWGPPTFLNAGRLCQGFILLLTQPPRPGLLPPATPAQPTLGAWQSRGLGVKIPVGSGGVMPASTERLLSLGAVPWVPLTHWSNLLPTAQEAKTTEDFQNSRISRKKKEQMLWGCVHS